MSKVTAKRLNPVSFIFISKVFVLRVPIATELNPLTGTLSKNNRESYISRGVHALKKLILTTIGAKSVSHSD